jgi:hypothetical protein
MGPERGRQFGRSSSLALDGLTYMISYIIMVLTTGSVLGRFAAALDLVFFRGQSVHRCPVAYNEPLPEASTTQFDEP